MKGVNVEIMGQNLVVASDREDGWVRSVAEAVDQRIKAIRASGHTVSSVNLAILAALNFADELARLRTEHQELLDQIDGLSRRLKAAVDDQAGAPQRRLDELRG